VEVAPDLALPETPLGGLFEDPDQDLPPLWDHRDELADPVTAVGLQHWRNFSYSETSASFTAGQDGFPLGDLNWFPELKAQWENGDPTSAGPPETIPDAFRIIGHYPNPFNPSATIEYHLAGTSAVSMEVFNVWGQRVDIIELGTLSPGVHHVKYDGGHLSSGIYLVKMQAGDEVRTLRITLVK
jgi:hypothetical protein